MCNTKRKELIYVPGIVFVLPRVESHLIFILDLQMKTRQSREACLESWSLSTATQLVGDGRPRLIPSLSLDPVSSTTALHPAASVSGEGTCWISLVRVSESVSVKIMAFQIVTSLLTQDLLYYYLHADMIQVLTSIAFFSVWFLWPATLALSGPQQQRPCPHKGTGEAFTVSTGHSSSQPNEVLHFHVEEALGI